MVGYDGGRSELYLLCLRLDPLCRRGGNFVRSRAPVSAAGNATCGSRIALEFPNEILGLAQLLRGASHRDSRDAGSGNKVKAATRAEIWIDDVRCLLRRKT